MFNLIIYIKIINFFLKKVFNKVLNYLNTLKLFNFIILYRIILL